MAMRLMSRCEFEKELRKAGLVPTDKCSVKGRIWTTQNNKKAMVPNNKNNNIPDFVLERVLREVSRLYY